MGKKAQLNLLSFLILVNVVVGVLVVTIYYDQLKARSCDSDSECGENSFCDENNRCQFEETVIESAGGAVTVQKHNVKWGVVFVVISLIGAALILRPKKTTLKTH